jgi:hypothetical protein
MPPSFVTRKQLVRLAGKSRAYWIERYVRRTRLGDVRHDWPDFVRVAIAGAACTWLGLAASDADAGWRTTAGVGAVLLFPLLLYLFGDITLGDVLRRVRGRSSTDVSNADDTSTPR